MNNCRLLFAAVLAAAFFGGCSMLPDGDPPEGNIIDNPQKKSIRLMSHLEAAEHLINILTIASLTHCPGETVFIDADKTTLPRVRDAVYKAGELSGISPAAAAGKSAILYSRCDMDKKLWHLKLIREGAVLWKDEIYLK